MNSFGRLFRLSIYGESHGNSVGVLIDGCPAGVFLSEKDFETENDYLVFVYYKDFRRRYETLVGFKILNTVERGKL